MSGHGNLQGKVALVTGGNRGIGKGCVLELARRGADVAVNYRSHKEEAAAVVAQVQEMGRRAFAMQGDVAYRQHDELLVRRTVEEFGRLDIVVANAAYSVRKPFLELEPEDVAATVDVTLWGAFHVAQFAAREMVKQGGGGSVIFISSVHAVLPIPNSLAYNVAKAGMNHMARCIAAELTGARIRVNVVEPGWTDTPGERRFATEEELQEAAKKLPLGRMATAEDIAWGVAYLASDEAAYVTGSVLRIDGGFVLKPLK